MVNQLRLAPGDTKDKTVDFCRSHGILPEAYSPLGTGKVFDVPELKSLAGKYGKTVAQICLRWSLQMGFLPLPKSVTPKYIRQNTDIFDFNLEDKDVELIAGMKGCCGESSNPDTKPF
jgi:diketogulonate reductase-like aldo/keto reductase